MTTTTQLQLQLQLRTMVDVSKLTCQICNHVGLGNGFDGFFYCLRCRSRYEDIVDTAVDDGDLFNKGGNAAIYMACHQRRRPIGSKAEPISKYDSIYESQSNFIRNLGLDDETPQRNNEAGKVKREEFDTVSPSVPQDFGGLKVSSFEDYHNEIRMRYVMGLQIMVELQCEALVKEFKVTPLICGLVGPIWLRFVSSTGVLDDDWPDKVIHHSEMPKEEEPEDHNTRSKYRAEPHNMFGQRAVMIWFGSLKKRIPLSWTVAVSFLACHVAREAVLPSDIMKWTLEGKFPYFSAFIEIERRMGHPSSACPISSSDMFRPERAVSVPKLELFAASIAQLIGLELPPVNFYAIAYRYLQRLSLSVDKILPYACRIYEWSMPPNLWLSLSKKDFRLPTNVCVMSILVVAIRILYNIHGFGEWEKSLSHNDGTTSKSTSSSTLKDDGELGTTFASQKGHDFCKDSNEDPVGPQERKLDCAVLLHHLEARYNDIVDTHEYWKDLPTYLQYCRDVVFAGSEPSFDNHEEERMIEYLWNVFKNEEDTKPSEPVKEQPKPFPTTRGTEPIEQSNISFNQTKLRDGGCISKTTMREKKRKECINESSSDDGICHADNLHGSVGSDSSSESLSNCEDSDSNENSSGNSPVKESIRKMRLDMEENNFCYIPPRVNMKRFDYLHYERKRDEGALTYVAHADYYILLRSCARVAQVDIRILHDGVLSLEKLLAWLEKKIDQCLHKKPPKISCQFCRDMSSENEN